MSESFEATIARARAAITPGPWAIEREELGVDFSDEEQETAYPESVGPLQGIEHDSLDVEQVEADVLAASTVPELLAVAEAAAGFVFPAHHRDRCGSRNGQGRDRCDCGKKALEDAILALAEKLRGSP